ncbi:F-box and leucine-rich repeat protein 2/20, partial [Lecanoromycetidae sp. Uapishka_2]
MSQVIWNDMTESPGALTPPTSQQGGPLPYEQPPKLKDLNLRGCAQMPESWGQDGQNITDACRNLEYFSLEGCRIDRTSVHYFLLRNPRLVHINFSGMKGLNNSALRIIGDKCHFLEHLNISWCHNVNTRGLLRIVQLCPVLKDLRAGEIKGFDDKPFLLELFNRNTLERLVLSHCVDLDDESLQVLIEGIDPEINPITDLAVVPPRNFRHLDLSRCAALTDKGVRRLARNVPKLSGLQLSHCDQLTDDALTGIFESTPLLTHLDIEELSNLTNFSLQNLAKAPSAPTLQHLNISFCENLGDTGMLPIIKSCHSLRTGFMDNTRVSDLVLTEAAAQVRARNHTTPVPASATSTPAVGLHLVVYDCQMVTWTGIREILSRNAEGSRSTVISLKCFYGYQDTVNEHLKRVLRGDAKAAARLERKWADYMIANEEAGAQGAGGRRRRRRLREAAAVHADEEEGGP